MAGSTLSSPTQVINFGHTWELTDSQVEKAIDINLIGVWRTDREAVKYMIPQGHGRIINVSSTAGLRATPYIAPYCMSKWGVIGLTKTLARELLKHRICVNTICPTMVKTTMCETPEYLEYIRINTGMAFHSAEEMNKMLNESRAMGIAFIDPEDVSRLCYWLATSKEAGLITGREIPFDLGTLLG